MKKTSELRAQSSEELEALVRENKSQIFNKRCALANKDNETKPHEIRSLRKEIARILTIRSERKQNSKA